MCSKKEKEVKLMFLGLDRSGKTSILKCIAGENIEKYVPTFGFNIRNFEMNNCVLNIWDIGGQQGLRAYWNTYCDESDGCVFVIDSSDPERLMEASNVLMNILDEEALSHVPLLIVGSKSDLKDAISKEEVVSHDQMIQKLCLNDIEGQKWKYVSTSAKSGEGIVEGLTWMLQNLPKLK